MKYISKLVKKRWVFLLSLALCLTPIIWFLGKDGAIVNGVDTNFPLDPNAWFLRRFHIWNSTVNAGQDFSSSTAGIFFHFIQFLFYNLGFGLQLTQIASFIFWFSAITLGAYAYSRTVFPKSSAARIVFVVFASSAYLERIF